MNYSKCEMCLCLAGTFIQRILPRNIPNIQYFSQSESECITTLKVAPVWTLCHQGAEPRLSMVYYWEATGASIIVWPCKLTFKGLYTDQGALHRQVKSWDCFEFVNNSLFLFYAQKKDIQRQIRAPMTRLLKTTVDGDYSLKPLPLSMSRV